MEENEEKIVQNKEVNKKILYIVGGAGLAFVIAFIVLIFLTIGYNNIYDGISINGIKVGGLSKEDAITTFNEYYKELGEVEISLYKDESVEFLASDIGANFNSEVASNIAYSIGREGNFFSKIFNGLKYRLTSKDIKLSVKILYVRLVYKL